MILKKFEWEDSKRWDAFCKKNGLAWFWHTSFRMKHALNSSFLITSDNYSFYAEDEGEIIAIAPLTIDTRNDTDGTTVKRKEMTYSGGMVPIPVVSQELKSKRREKVFKTIFVEIDKIALEHNVQRLVMKIPLTLTYCKKNIYYNILMKYGFQDISLNTVVVDLEKSESNLWKELSENHRRSINKGRKHLNIKIFDKKNITEKIFDSFKSYYFKSAGKVTRPETTFQLLYYYLTHDMAIMGQALYRDRPVGYSVAVYYKNEAYYLMGANEKNFTQCPIAHVIHWEIMRYLKERGISHYEMGIQQFGPCIHDQPSTKEMAISRFKRGFGGLTIPLFIGEKIYTKNYYKKLWQSRIENSSNLIY
jgi:hypothetical protein